MNFSLTFLLNANGLFDFDLTFPTQALLFLILATIVSFVFLSPISKQLDSRAESINFNLRKSGLLITYGYEKITDCVGMLTSEISENSRQIKIIRNLTNSKFEDEVVTLQIENLKILNKLKGDLTIKSALLLSNLTPDLTSLTNDFFAKKFQSP
jgi:hypothetical protein